MTKIRRIKTALREASQFYVQLHVMGFNVEFVDIVVGSAVFTEIKVFALESCNQIAQCFAHLFGLTEF